MVGADRLGHQVGDERRIDTARQPDDRVIEPSLAKLAADELP